jgi:uncharacterized protein
MQDASAAVPVAQSDRIVEVDILRGVALFGVLAMNFVGFAGPYVFATEAELAALPTAGIDRAVNFLVEWLIGDKANTMFATLFGLGFYIQLQRGEGRPGFARRYARRLTWLLVFGILNLLFLWVWDILHLYALAGFFLLLMRRWSTRALVIFGLVAALYSGELQKLLASLAGLPPLIPDSDYSDAAVLERQQALLSGDYLDIVVLFARWTWIEWLASGIMAAWVVYALGRFALGAAIGRSGILDDVARHLPMLRRIARIALPGGLVFALVVRLLQHEQLGNGELGAAIGEALRSPAALLLVAGYASAILVACQSGTGRRVFALFGPVGQMALTNYLMQGLAYGFVLSGVGPGLELAGKIGTAAVMAICIAVFALQIGVSHWWLARYRFGPMEWLWRWLTYGGAMPPLRRAG